MITGSSTANEGEQIIDEINSSITSNNLYPLMMCLEKSLVSASEVKALTDQSNLAPSIIHTRLI